jgi:hypothetical protein
MKFENWQAVATHEIDDEFIAVTATGSAEGQGIEGFKLQTNRSLQAKAASHTAWHASRWCGRDEARWLQVAFHHICLSCSHHLPVQLQQAAGAAHGGGEGGGSDGGYTMRVKGSIHNIDVTDGLFVTDAQHLVDDHMSQRPQSTNLKHRSESQKHTHHQSEFARVVHVIRDAERDREEHVRAGTARHKMPANTRLERHKFPATRPVHALRVVGLMSLHLPQQHHQHDTQCIGVGFAPMQVVFI